ncbi:MAG: DUF2004 domain-containing protein [Lentisphaerae bacterium]|jgi:hypothetical protein|nr:DUF2004 domain-containing protein [Lentisphaerota bacterium]MBT4816284.1 DUF2004 domain-containing protein [Lentisphaerota bacterium]MBT5610920.1 DUF2004 domain-containing protein [Lentisphaerota bacterium]MBT7053439.1 DUF2004 domain-containing protein [Lentisphaerota bacterium]MBT7840703.1 DUF2004 domain-containing protein [Lentisphaerota bacterium]
MTDSEEVARRKAAALAAIRAESDPNGGCRLFVSHHLDELEESFWIQLCGTARPAYEDVIEKLVLQSHWSEDDEDEGIDSFDFTLPDDVTDYLICVRFDDSGTVDDIAMES